MAKSDYLPPRDNDFLIWHDRFKTGVTAQAAVLGLTPAEVAGVGADNADLRAKITASSNADAASQQATREKATVRQAVEKRVRTLARRIKTQPAYTDALGAQLGIEGPEDATDLATAKPELWATPQAGGVVELGFSKSKSDGVNLYSQREGDANFVFLARDTASPYVDNRPLLAAGKPELRRYKAIYVLADDEVGQPSNEVTVTVGP